MKVLVSDSPFPVGVRLFQETPGIDADVNIGLAPQALKEIIGNYDGLVIRRRHPGHGGHSRIGKAPEGHRPGRHRP